MSDATSASAKSKKRGGTLSSTLLYMRQHWQLYVLFIMPAFVLTIIFRYIHQLGYLAFAPINGTVAEINAFALGAALVDPYATVHLKWLSATTSWQDELIEANVDVISDRDYLDPTSPDEPYGLYTLHDGRIASIGMPVWDWARYYELLFNVLLADGVRTDQKKLKGRAINYWWGMKAGVVRLNLADGIALGQRRLNEALSKAVLDGWLAPFDTLLVDQQGNELRGAGDLPLTDSEIAAMSWLNVNVVGSLPSVGELTAGGRSDVEAAGVVLLDMKA